MKLKRIFICLLMFSLIVSLSEFYISGGEYNDIIVGEKAGNVVFLNKNIKLKSPMCFLNGRLFLPLEDMIISAGGNVTQTEEGFSISWSTFQYEIMKQQDEMLVYPLYINKESETAYISLYDISQLFHLAVVFDSKNETIYFYKRQMPIAYDMSAMDNLGKAYLRLEDVTTQPTYNDEALEKFRVIIDYLYSKGQSFYIAWIPYYINPPENIRNDVTRDFNFYNADFVYTLDYAVNHFGNIVLHGFTHQENDTVSGVGCEFGKDSPFRRQEIDERMKQAKLIARKLGYDDSIFEFPHTASTVNQLEIAENNFDIIYQQSYYRKCMGKIDVVRKWKHNVLYVPTPAGYVSSYEDLPNVLERIDELPNNQITSMYVHPYLDFNKVSCSTKDAERIFNYEENGIFPQLVDKIINKNLIFSPIK